MTNPLRHLNSAILFSIVLHGALFAFGASSMIQAPHATLESGVSAIELVFREKKEKKNEMKPVEDVVAVEKAREVDVKPREEAPEESMASVSSEGAIWVEPRYVVNAPPRYPRGALLRGLEGDLVLVVHISVEGRVLDLEVVESSGYRTLDQAALRAVKNWVFEPAMRDTRTIPSRARIPIEFKIGETV